MAKDLTIKALENLKPQSTRREIPDGHTRGLYFILQPSGIGSWAYRYRFANKPRKLTLGPYPEIDLAKARGLAAAAKQSVANDEDPAVTKLAAKKAAQTPADPVGDLFENVLEEYLKRHAEKNTRKSSFKVTKGNLERDFLPKWRGRRLSEITRKDVLEVLDAIVDRDAPVQANRSLASLRKMCNWAIEREIISSSPCDRLSKPTVEKNRNRILSLDEIRLAWTAFEQDGWPFGDIARILVLTGQREVEVGAMEWSEIDFEGRVWNLPAERSKNKLPHKIPLSDQVINILKGAPRIKYDGEPSRFVFTTTGRTPVSGYSRAKTRFDRIILELMKKQAVDAGSDPEKVKSMPNWTYHDLRRSATSHMASLGFLPHVVDAIINHKSGSISGVAAIYNVYEYLDERREALAAWPRRIDELIADEISAENDVGEDEGSNRRGRNLSPMEMLLVADDIDRYRDVLIRSLRSGNISDDFACLLADLIDPHARAPFRLDLRRRAPGGPQPTDFSLMLGICRVIDDFAPSESITAAKVFERAQKMGVDLSLGGNRVEAKTILHYKRLIAEIRDMERAELKKALGSGADAAKEAPLIRAEQKA